MPYTQSDRRKRISQSLRLARDPKHIGCPFLIFARAPDMRGYDYHGH
jgi:hypothetical protein